MLDKLLLKAMVLGAMAVSLSATGIAADVHNTNGGESTQQAVVTDEAKRDAISSNWKDRTDILAKFQTNSKPQYGIETLQPIRHYDNNSKSVVFLQGKVTSQGGISRTADGYANHVTRNAGGHIYEWSFDQSKQSIGTTGSLGIGYRRLSKEEHSYVGINAFYDYAFKEHYKRGSLGVEYVTGENEFYANFYKLLGSTTSSYRKFTRSLPS